MRITSGKLKGLKLKTPRFTGLRPMTERTRKALFDILGPRVQGARVLDLFCGTGAVGLEALSRGAKQVVFVDANPRSLSLVRENLKHARMLGQASLKRLTLPQGLDRLRGPFDLIFVTPPYDQVLGALVVKTLPPRLLAPEALVIVEERQGTSLPKETDILTLVQERRYGEAQLSFYRRK